jgi:hypothetical protein
MDGDHDHDHDHDHDKCNTCDNCGNRAAEGHMMLTIPAGPAAGVLSALSFDAELLASDSVVCWLTANMAAYKETNASYLSFKELLETAASCMLSPRPTDEIRMLLMPLCPQGMRTADWPTLLEAFVRIIARVHTHVPFPDKETAHAMIGDCNDPRWADVPEPHRAFYRCFNADSSFALEYLKVFVVRAVDLVRTHHGPSTTSE